MSQRTTFPLFLFIGAVMSWQSTAVAQDQRPAMLTAARELNRQMTILQDLFGTDQRLLQIVGLLPQTIDFQNALFDFRQKINNGASREEIVIGFDVVDRKLSAILDEITLVEKADASVRVVVRHLRGAASALHFAVFARDGSPARQSAGLLRQALAQQAFVASLSNNVAWLFAGQQTLQGWSGDLTKLQQSLATLEQMAQNKATAADVKRQFIQVDTNWGAIMQRYDAAAQQNQLLLRSFIVLVDQGFGRLASIVGCNDRRAALSE